MRARALWLVTVIGLAGACAEGTGLEDDDGASKDGGWSSSSSGDLTSSSSSSGGSSGITSDGAVGDGAVGNDAANDGAVGEDATVDGGNDAGTLPPDPPNNVVVNGSFEQWQDGLAVGWHGSVTQTGSLTVSENTAFAYDGVRSANLRVTGASHRRFSTAAREWIAGDYHCSYWVRGKGKIRNAYYDGKYSNYTSYTTVDGDEWRRVDYSFDLNENEPAFELIFSVQEASGEGVTVDRVVCTRDAEPCDDVQCEAWQQCDAATASCQTSPGFCADDAGCAAHKRCDLDTHVCVLRDDRCDNSADCGDPALRCDETLTCVDGDPCVDVQCAEWQTCNPATLACELSADRCMVHADCGSAMPVCNRTTHLCEAIDSPLNVVPNGSFEVWDNYPRGNFTFFVPEFWYGVTTPDSELPATAVKRYETAAFTGSYAMQLVYTNASSKRVTSQRFAVQSGKTYDCAYRVRGKGNIHARSYCNNNGPQQDVNAIDSDEWQTIALSMSANASTCALIFYPSSTNASRDHLQIDGVVCTQR